MASAQNPVKLSSELAVSSQVYDVATATTEGFGTWYDMRDYDKYLAVLTFVSGTGVLTMKLYCSGSATGADTPVLIREHAAPTDADAAGDTLILECTGEEIAALASATCVHPRYVALKLDFDHADDIAQITTIRAGGKQGAGLTAGVIS